jgi:geranylgeranyl diphosphate synthase type II
MGYESVIARLSDYSALVSQAIADRMPHDASTTYLLEPLMDYPSRGGKGIRPALCLATCEAFGGRAEDALAAAVALEMLHNAFLIHDDIEDSSVLRRGQPTLHQRYGLPIALNAGDALALLACGVLQENFDSLGHALARDITREFDFMGRQTVDGQALELGWRIDNRLDLEPDDYLNLVMKKTCWYTTVLPLRAGALIGSRGAAALAPMIDFGFHLGAAFQIQDDILNLTRAPDSYGKDALGDLIEGKRTLMLIHVVAAASPGDRDWIEQYLARPLHSRQAHDARVLLAMMNEYGSIGFARQFGEGVAQSARAAFVQAFGSAGPSAARTFVEDLIPFMLARES